MSEEKMLNNQQLPTPDEIHCALDIYLSLAWPEGLPETVNEFLPPKGDFDVVAWIMGESVERDSPQASPAKLRCAAFRLGNMFYPHMKLRLSRPPKETLFLFSVDSHDTILHAKAGTADYAMLEELKVHNAKLNEAIVAGWEKANLPTEKKYLRLKIRQAREKKSNLQ